MIKSYFSSYSYSGNVFKILIYKITRIYQWFEMPTPTVHQKSTTLSDFAILDQDI